MARRRKGHQGLGVFLLDISTFYEFVDMQFMLIGMIADLVALVSDVLLSGHPYVSDHLVFSFRIINSSRTC